MEDRISDLERRILGVEKRLLRLEGTTKPPPIIIPPEDFQAKKSDERGYPIGGIILLIIGGLILYFSVPGFLSSIFNYGYSYGHAFNSFYLALVVIGSLLATLGLRSILRYRERSKLSSKEPSELKTEEVKEVASASEVKKVPEEQKQSFEFRVVATWFGVVGIIAIVLGVVFFLKFAFDNHIIGPVGQVSIGIFFGLALLGLGEYFRGKYAKYSQIITGGGIVVLYVSLWAAYTLFHLTSATVMFSAMSVVTLTASLLSIRYRAIYIAALVIFGGFATPALLEKGVDNELLLMTYVVILNLGVLTIAAFENWQKLNILSFAATYLVFTSWFSAYYKPEKLLITEIFLTILFLIFSLIWFAYNIVNNKKTEDTDVLLEFANAGVYFGFSYLILKQSYFDFLGFFSLILAIFYFFVGYFSYKKYQDSHLTLGFLGISLVFLTIAVPLQVKKNLITIIWTIEGAILLWVGFWLGSYRVRVAALAVYMLVAGRLLLFDIQLPLSEFSLFVNRRFVTFVAAALSTGVAAWIYQFYKEKMNKEESPVTAVLLISLNVILVWAFSMESFSYFDKRIEEVTKANKVTMEQNSVVLGTRTVSRSITQAFDDVSVTCKIYSNNEIYLGIDTGCQPATAISARFVFGNIDVPKSVVITSVKLNLTAADPYDKPATYKISLVKAGMIGSSTNLVTWQVKNWAYLEQVSTPDLTVLAQELVNSQSWNMGGSILVTIEPVGASDSYRRVFAFEREPQRSARLLITYNTTESDLPFEATPNSQFGIGIQGNMRQNSPYPNDYQPNQKQYQSQQNYYKPPVQLDAKAQTQIKGLRSARDVSLSIIWLLYSIVLITIGVVAKYKPIRLSAIIFFVVTILKVFLFDSSNLQLGYRIVAFMVLGVILLTVSLIYQKYRQQIGAFLLKDE